MRRYRSMLAVLCAVGLSACALSPDAAPRDLPADERSLARTQTGEGNEAEGSDRIYLVAPGEDRLLRSVPREADTRADLIATLLDGPNATEAEQQFRTFIPTTLGLNSPPRLQGTLLFLDVSDELLELTGASLSQALAQIVYTASELDGVSRIQITVNGQPQSWARPNSDPTTEPLSIYDYPGFVRSAQPALPAVPAGA